MSTYEHTPLRDEILELMESVKDDPHEWEEYHGANGQSSRGSLMRHLAQRNVGSPRDMHDIFRLLGLEWGPKESFMARFYLGKRE